LLDAVRTAVNVQGDLATSLVVERQAGGALATRSHD